jgi:lipoprotein-anchoring transpeptidase ErfK/SrfK
LNACDLNADGIRIHGTENVASVGTAASHGCMRMQRHDIEEFYPMVPVGTPVYIVQ